MPAGQLHGAPADEAAVADEGDGAALGVAVGVEMDGLLQALERALVDQGALEWRISVAPRQGVEENGRGVMGQDAGKGRARPKRLV